MKIKSIILAGALAILLGITTNEAKRLSANTDLKHVDIFLEPKLRDVAKVQNQEKKILKSMQNDDNNLKLLAEVTGDNGEVDMGIANSYGGANNYKNEEKESKKESKNNMKNYKKSKNKASKSKSSKSLTEKKSAYGKKAMRKSEIQIGTQHNIKKLLRIFTPKYPSPIFHNKITPVKTFSNDKFEAIMEIYNKRSHEYQNHDILNDENPIAKYHIFQKMPKRMKQRKIFVKNEEPKQDFVVFPMQIDSMIMNSVSNEINNNNDIKTDQSMQFNMVSSMSSLSSSSSSTINEPANQATHPLVINPSNLYTQTTNILYLNPITNPYAKLSLYDQSNTWDYSNPQQQQQPGSNLPNNEPILHQSSQIIQQEAKAKDIQMNISRHNATISIGENDMKQYNYTDLESVNLKEVNEDTKIINSSYPFDDDYLAYLNPNFNIINNDNVEDISNIQDNFPSSYTQKPRKQNEGKAASTRNGHARPLIISNPTRIMELPDQSYYVAKNNSNNTGTKYDFFSGKNAFKQTIKTSIFLWLLLFIIRPEL